MDFFQTQDFFKQLHPEKKISYEFDEKCHRVHEIIYTDGKPNPIHHIESDKVKITVEGQETVYISIMPHREIATWEYMKEMINKKSSLTE